MKVLFCAVGVTNTEKASPLGSVVHCMYSSCHVSQQRNQSKAVLLKHVFECPLLVVCTPCPSKAVAIHPTLASHFLALNLSHVNKRPLGNTVKVL